jgi:glycine oxidase
MGPVRPLRQKPVPLSIFYNANVKSWDVIVIGGGIIGLSLAIALRKRGASVLVLERGEPGREASHAAAGMLADYTLETPAALQSLATASARLYPEFVHQLQDESGIRVDLRSHGALVFADSDSQHLRPGLTAVLHEPLSQLEPALKDSGGSVFFLKERSVDPPALVAAALKAAKHREVDISSGTAAREVMIENGRVAGVKTDKSTYHAATVVNCAGAWAGELTPPLPTRPVKGQLLSVVGVPRNLLQHVIRTPDVYLVPRSDGRIVIGATVEEAGFDKRTDPDTIHRLHQAAISLLPALGHARVLEAWAGLRPGTPDNLPMLGSTSLPGYFAATGHFRDGILLAPITAHLMAQLITGSPVEYSLLPFSPERFAA